ncbi:MAG: DUF616 domain-containing protein [Lachnospiraceae bacterium]|mgnify:CR=1 FL=1|nr:DUF616 domain-containing protein [Lachnospiraceae bacterium]
MLNKNSIAFLEQQKNNRKFIAIYCAGQHGVLFSEILKACGLEIDVFLDSNKSKWGHEIIDGIYCVEPYSIVNRDDYFIIICINAVLYQEVYQTVCGMGFRNVVSFNEILDDIIRNNAPIYFELIKQYQFKPRVELFYTPGANREIPCNYGRSYKSEKIAVYTGIFGDYDKICEPQAFPDNIDYYFISDKKPKNIGVFQWIDAKKVIPEQIVSPIKKNRFIKMHPHLLFPDYNYSIYIDGNVIVKKDITFFVKDSISGISAFMHPKRNCIYYEAITVVNFRRVAADDVCEQMKRYLEQGMPLHYGMAEMPVIAREHNKSICIKIMEEWWKEFSNGTQRDQLSFMYVMWKNRMTLKDIASLGNDAHESDAIKFQKHLSESKLLSK